MSTLKTIIDSLPDESRQQLMYAFEYDLSQYVDYNGNKFVGVNINNLRHLDIEERIGKWSIGIVKGK